MRVLQWNIHHGTDASGKYNLDRLATWMATMEPDIIMLNEVEKFTYLGQRGSAGAVRGARRGQDRPQLVSLFSQEFGDWSANGKGHLILSTYPFESTAQRARSATTASIGAAGITVNGRNISLIVTHLDPYSQSVRLAQAKEVTTWASTIADNRILTGDMNAWPDQTSIARVQQDVSRLVDRRDGQGRRVRRSAGLAPDGATKNGRIDYIFYSKTSSNLVVIDSRVYDTRNSSGVMASDHRPVVTTFEVR